MPSAGYAWIGSNSKRMCEEAKIAFGGDLVCWLVHVMTQFIFAFGVDRFFRARRATKRPPRNRAGFQRFLNAA